MTDIEIDAEMIPAKLSFMSSTSDCRSRATSVINDQAVDYNTTLSAVVPPIINEAVETNEDLPLFPLRKVYTNLIIISIAFTLLFTAYSNILSIQSSLNAKGNVGVNSLIVLNIFILVSSLKLKKETKQTLFVNRSSVPYFSPELPQIYLD